MIDDKILISYFYPNFYYNHEKYTENFNANSDPDWLFTFFP